jgi:hypothetical protein
MLTTLTRILQAVHAVPYCSIPDLRMMMNSSILFRMPFLHTHTTPTQVTAFAILSEYHE